jgi:hypothetical protein
MRADPAETEQVGLPWLTFAMECAGAHRRLKDHFTGQTPGVKPGPAFRASYPAETDRAGRKANGPNISPLAGSLFLADPAELPNRRKCLSFKVEGEIAKDRLKKSSHESRPAARHSPMARPGESRPTFVARVVGSE